MKSSSNVIGDLHKEIIDFLLNSFGVTKEEYETHRDYYNNNFDKYDNDIYEDVKTRIVHLSNFFEKANWFNNRYDLVFKHSPDYDEIIDVGYGLPYLALQLAENNNESSVPHLILVDKYKSAEKVSRKILERLGLGADFVTKSIDDQHLLSQVRSLQKSQQPLLVAIEVVEHLENPEIFWKFAQNIMPKNLIISLPIGPKIPSHLTVFKTLEEARDYLKKYLVIQEEQVISPEASGEGIDKYKCLIVFGSLITE